jgi:hypothetical protein
VAYIHTSEVSSGIHFGDHVSSIYQNKEQQFLLIIPFMVEGLKSNQKCVYVFNDNTKEEVIKEFKKAGFELEEYLKSGQFELINSKDVYLKDGIFETDKMLATVEALEKKSFEDGYWGLRGSGEMGKSIDENVSETDLIDYESKLNEFLVGRKIALICQYNENKVEHRLLNNIIRTHPFIIIYGKMYENKYFYTAPEYMDKGSDLLPADEYETIIDTITTE